MKEIVKPVYLEEDRGILGMKSTSAANNDLTDIEKTVLYNMVYDQYYKLIMQDVSDGIRKEYLQQWQDDLKVILKKLKQLGWNVYEE